ncbi:hypothetical protein ACOMHN_046945 [Nucella lapillus]
MADSLCPQYSTEWPTVCVHSTAQNGRQSVSTVQHRMADSLCPHYSTEWPTVCVHSTAQNGRQSVSTVYSTVQNGRQSVSQCIVQTEWPVCRRQDGRPEVRESRSRTSQHYSPDDLYKPRTSHRRPLTPPPTRRDRDRGQLFSSDSRPYHRGRMSEAPPSQRNPPADPRPSTHSQKVTSSSQSESSEPRPVTPSVMADLELEPVSPDDDSLNVMDEEDETEEEEEAKATEKGEEGGGVKDGQKAGGSEGGRGRATLRRMGGRRGSGDARRASPSSWWTSGRPLATHGAQGPLPESVEHEAQGPHLESVEHGAQGPLLESVEHGAQGLCPESVEHGTQGPHLESAEHASRGPHLESVEHASRGPHLELVEHGAQGPHLESVEHGAQGPHLESVEHVAQGPHLESVERGAVPPLPAGAVAGRRGRGGTGLPPPPPSRRPPPTHSRGSEVTPPYSYDRSKTAWPATQPPADSSA